MNKVRLASSLLASSSLFFNNFSEKKTHCSGWFACLGPLPTAKKTIKENLVSISEKGYTSISLMQHKRQRISPSSSVLTLDFDPSKPKFQDNFSFVKFLNKKENNFDCLDESILYIEKIPKYEEYLFALGHTLWKPNQEDKNYQLMYNKNEELILTFEGDILNRKFLEKFLLVKQGKIKEMIKFDKKSSSLSFCDQQIKPQSNELLLLNLFKYFLNNFFCDQKAFQKLVGIVKGPMAISIFNKKNPERLLCFWRDIPIYFHGESFLETNTDKKEKDSSFDFKQKFSSISLSTSKSDSWEESMQFESDKVHIITLLPHHEVSLEIGGPALEQSSNLKLEKSPTINAPVKIVSSSPKSNLRSEIFEQPHAIRRLLKLEERHLESLDTLKLDSLEGFEDFFSPDQRLVITGCGSSFFAGSAGARFFRKMRIFRDVKMVNSVEFDQLAFIPPKSSILNVFGAKSFSDFSSHVLQPQSESEKSSRSPSKQRVPENICIAVSQSGESSDVLNFLKQLKASSACSFVIALTNTPGSSLTKMADVSFFVNSGEELAVAATKSVTNTVVAFHMLALWFEYLFRGPRLTDQTNFRTKGKFYQRIQALPFKNGFAEGGCIFAKIKIICLLIIPRTQSVFIRNSFSA